MKRYLFSALLMGFVLAQSAQAKLTVVTTVPDLRAIVSEVGGSEIQVEAIAKGTQDPHYIEAKPSFMTKAAKSDLLVAIGLDLEVGWLPSITRGARNPKINPGNKGYLEIGPLVQPLEVPQGGVTRAEGDVHPFGNPHVLLDPVRAGQVAIKIAERLAELDAPHAEQFQSRAKAFQNRLTDKLKGWQARVEKSGVKDVISYHKTLTYFFDRFKLGNPAILEPKPGIPPTSGHVLEVIELMKSKKISLILVENYFDPSVTKRIKEAVPTARIAVVPVSVDGDAGIVTLDDLYDKLVSSVEGK